MHIKPFSLLCALAADTTRAHKTGYATLSEETMLENLISEIDDKSPFQELLVEKRRIRRNKKTMVFKRKEEWPGVTLSVDGFVTEIRWGERKLGGTLDLNWIPRQTTDFFIGKNACFGECTLVGLPETMQRFDAVDNNLRGNPDLTQLPQTIEHIFLSGNKLSGSIDLTQLPESLVHCWLCGNDLSGSVDIDFLPPYLEVLLLRDNRLGGTVNLSRIPESLRALDLGENAFSGKLTHRRFRSTRRGSCSIKTFSVGRSI